MRLPSRSNTRMQCSHRTSTPSVAANARLQAASRPSSAAGKLAVVASRHGIRFIGNVMLGPISGSRTVSGRAPALEVRRARARTRDPGSLRRHPVRHPRSNPRGPGRRRDILRPVGHVVSAVHILTALLTRNGATRLSRRACRYERASQRNTVTASLFMTPSSSSDIVKIAFALKLPDGPAERSAILRTS